MNNDQLLDTIQAKKRAKVSFLTNLSCTQQVGLPPVPSVLGVRGEAQATPIVDHQYKQAPVNLGTIDVPAQLEDFAFCSRGIQLMPDEFSLFDFLRIVFVLLGCYFALIIS